MFVYTPLACSSTNGNQTRVSYLLKVELQRFLSHQIGGKNGTRVLWKSS